MIFPYGDAETNYLSQRDPLLGEAIARIGKIEREVVPDFFAGMVNAIAGQQISTRAFLTIWDRLCHTYPALTPEAVLACPDDLHACGIGTRKVQYILGIAQEIVNGTLSPARLHALTDAEILDTLMRLRGVGAWTAEMLLLFTFQRKDILSFADYGIRKGICALHGDRTFDEETRAHFRALYTPYGSIASLYFWQIAAQS